MIGDLNENVFWPYLAGFFDGEGNISNTRGNVTWKLSQSGKEGHELLGSIRYFLKERCNLKGKLSLVQSVAGPSSNLIKKPKNPRDYWELRVCRGESVYYILKRIYPYLHIKKLAVQDLLRYWKMYPPLTRGFIMRLDTTHCINGHQYTEENTQWQKRPNGLRGRHCRTCKRAKDLRGRITRRQGVR